MSSSMFRRGRRGIAPGVGALAAILVLAACGGETSSAESDDDGPFTIGIVTSLSGNYQFLGPSTEAGVKAAVEVINEDGGIDGRTVETVTCDDQTNPQTARQCFEKVVSGDGADALVGFPLAAATDAVAPLVEQNKIPTWLLGGSYGGRDLNGQKYMFASLPVTDDVLDVAFGWAAEQGFKDGWIVTSDDETGAPCREFPDASDEERHGIDVLGVSTMKADATTAAAQMAQVDRDADWIFLCVSGGGGIVAAVSYQQAGLEMPAFAIHSQGAPFIAQAMAGKVDNDKLYVAGFCPLGVGTGLTEEYACVPKVEQFADVLGGIDPDVTPDYMAALGYDGAMLLAQAFEDADGDPDSVVSALEDMDGVDGVLGQYTFGPDVHRGIGPEQMLAGVFRDGAWVLSDPLQLPTGS
jgi:branched-chain amino acid transport system substrate-binding protein